MIGFFKNLIFILEERSKEFKKYEDRIKDLERITSNYGDISYSVVKAYKEREKEAKDLYLRLDKIETQIERELMKYKDLLVYPMKTNTENEYEQK